MDAITKRERPRRQMSKGMYILPSLFTTANMAAGFYAILEVVHGTALATWHFDNAAKAIGFAVLFDGLDGRVARMTGTSSDFGKEFDSLTDVITFGVAPAMLAWTWGFHFMPPIALTEWNIKLAQLGAIASFLFLISGASRLARFNITSNPVPSNPGRPGKKYFVGMPIPAGAGVVAAVVHFQSGVPLESSYTAVPWLALVAAVGYLMVSTWRFYSFKDIDFSARRPFRVIILLAALVAGIWYFSKPVLFAVALLYTFSRSVLAVAVDFPPPQSASTTPVSGGFADFMSSPTKIASPPSSSVRGQLYRAAIVGAGTLKGKEIAEMLTERNFPVVDVRLLDDDESIGQLEATGDEINFIQSVRAEQFTNTDFTFFAADAETTRQNWKRARDAGSAIIDLSGALEEEPGATVRSLWIERERGRCGSPNYSRPLAWWQSRSRSAGFVVAARTQSGGDPQRRSHNFGTSFRARSKGYGRVAPADRQPLIVSAAAKDIFDTQLAFNVLARYGSNSKLSLDTLESRVRRHYQKIAGLDAAQPPVSGAASRLPWSRPCRIS